MATQPEGKLSRKIIKAWKDRGAYSWKVMGNEFTPAGTPDIVGVYKGFFIYCETKMPGNKPSDIQIYRMAQMNKAGAIGGVCYSVEDAFDVLDRVDGIL